jgi:hypothetical protein
MSFGIDEDNLVSNSDTKFPTQQSVKAYVDNTVTGIFSDQGNYDAATDTPSLDDGTPIAGILKGYVYVVAVPGMFFTQNVEVGDTIRAMQDAPTLETHWAIAQTNLDAASVKVLYESNADTNAFTNADETKLDGIEPSADVTDTTNVTAAGALMDSELASSADVKALNQSVVSGASPTFTLANATALPVAGIANGTAGEIITWSAGGVATVVPAGTATYVLTSNGIGAAPTFQAPNGLGVINDQTGAPYSLLSSDTNSLVIIDDTFTIPTGLPVGFQCSVLNDSGTIETLTTTGNTVKGNDVAASISAGGVISLIVTAADTVLITGEME